MVCFSNFVTFPQYLNFKVTFAIEYITYLKSCWCVDRIHAVVLNTQEYEQSILSRFRGSRVRLRPQEPREAQTAFTQLKSRWPSLLGWTSRRICHYGRKRQIWSENNIFSFFPYLIREFENKGHVLVTTVKVLIVVGWNWIIFYRYSGQQGLTFLDKMVTVLSP